MPSQLVLVSGLSGSGKSIASAVLEDAGYYCIDNLPLSLVESVVSHLSKSGQQRIGIAVDARGGEDFVSFPERLKTLQASGFDVRVIFLEAKTPTLVKRFSETRRKHPLSSDSVSLAEAIELEREKLASVMRHAHRIDTSDLAPGTLCQWVRELVSRDKSRITLLFQSFGFKHGIPLDADLVFDVRCLPNPHYVPELRPLTGRDAAVKNYIEASPEAVAMLSDIRSYIEKWLPCFIHDNRAYLTVAIGCTGGQHRSVYFVESLGQTFARGEQVLVRHRELAL